MNRTDLTKHILLIPAGLIVLFWTLYLMVSPLKFALGVVLFLITLIAGELLLLGDQSGSDDEGRGKLPQSTHRISNELAIVVLFALFLAIILSVPAIKGEIFVEWITLELPNIARIVAAFAMNFLPGYMILAIVGRGELGRLPKLVASYFLSFFVLTIVAFAGARIAGIVNELFLELFSFACTLLILTYVLRRLLLKKPNFQKEDISAPAITGFRKVLPALLVGLTVAFIGVWFWWMYSSIGFFIGAQGTDMWRIHSTAQDFLDYRAFNLLQFPWWLNLYLAGFTIISGVPLANSYLTLFPLIGLAVLSFYAMSMSFFKNRRTASLATLSYAIFSGPAWLYALYLRDFSSIIGYDEWKAIIYEASGKFLLQGWYPPFVVGLNGAVLAYAALWFLMYATWQLDLRNKFNLFLMSIVLAICYMVHGVDPVIFVVYLAALLIVCSATGNDEGKERVRRGALSVLLGIGLAALIDVSMTPEYDYFNSVSIYALDSRYFYFNSPTFYLLAFGSTAIIILTYSKLIRNRVTQIGHFAHRRLSQKHFDSLKRYVPETILYFYGISLVVFIMLLPSLSPETTLLGQVPWYVYLVVGGVPSLFGVVGISVVLHKWSELDVRARGVLAFCAVSILLLFIFGQAVSFINETFFYTRFWERRTFVYIQPLMSLLMAYALVTLFGRINVKKLESPRNLGKIAIASLLTSMIVLSSVSSTLVAGDFAQVGYFASTITKEELEALKFLHYSLPIGSPVAYINQRTGTDFIRAFASDKWSYDRNLWVGQYYRSPSSAISALRSTGAQYLYLNRIRDLNDLKKNLFLEQLIRVLPIAFNNSEVTIYSIPSLRSPSLYSSLGLVSPKETEGSVYDAYVSWFWTLVMSQHSYSVIWNTSNTVALNYAETVIMPYDPLQTAEDAGQLLEWVSNGGHLIVSNTNEFGMFAESIGLKTRVPLANCDSTENWNTRYERGEISLENAVKIEGNASLRLQNNLSAWESWIYTPPVPWNLSQYEYLGIWVYGTGGGPIWYLYLTDSEGSASYYRYDLSFYDPDTKNYEPSFIGWKLILVPIEEAYGHLNLSAIAELHIDTGWQLPVNILIDEIFVIEESHEPTFVLANGVNGETLSIEFPLVGVEGLGFSGSSSIIANYTKDGASVAPFAFQQELGDGKVTYLNSNLLYEFILSESSGLRSPYEILLRVLEMITAKP